MRPFAQRNFLVAHGVMNQAARDGDGVAFEKTFQIFRLKRSALRRPWLFGQRHLANEVIVHTHGISIFIL
jgi:hypothetical protein